MKKTQDGIETKKKKSYPKWLICIAVGAAVLFLIIGVPYIINECYKAECGYLTMWDAAGVLAFYGAILAAAGTGLGVFASVRAANKNYREDARMRVLPYIAVTPFERKARVNPDALFQEQVEKRHSSTETKSESAVQYKEQKLERVYFVIDSNEIKAQYELNKHQQEILEHAGYKWVRMPNGVSALRAIDYYSIPLEIENVGNGAAINFHVGFNRIGDEALYEYVRPTVLKQGQTLYVHIFSTEKFETVRGNYVLGFAYEDIYGNEYEQQFPVEYGEDESGQEYQSITLVGEQKRR